MTSTCHGEPGTAIRPTVGASKLLTYPVFHQYDGDRTARAVLNHVAAGRACQKLVVTATGGGCKASAVKSFRACKAQRDGVRLATDANCRCNPHEARTFRGPPGSGRPTCFEKPLHRIDARSLARSRSKYRTSPSAGQRENHPRRFRDACNPTFLTSRSRAASRAASNSTRTIPPSSPTLEIRRSPQVKAGRISQHPSDGLTNGGLVGSESRMRIVGGRSFVGHAPLQQGGGYVPDAARLGPGTGGDALHRTRFRPQDRSRPDGHLSGRNDHRHKR